MDFIDRLQALAKKLDQDKSSLATEEATKNALVMPFLHSVLGYDVFNPNEVIPEFTADCRTKKNEKVDYALMKDGEVQILIECKKYGDSLTTKHANQLYRYFSVVHARLGILTNGAQYEFYTDLDEPNKMDEKPFLTLDLEDIDEHVVPEVKKLTKSSFDVESVVGAAGELKYLNQIKKLIAEEFKDPSEDFVRLFASQVYPGPLTVKVKAQFLELTSKALKQYLNDSINERLKSAIGESSVSVAEAGSQPEALTQTTPTPDEAETKKPNVVTTEEELDGYQVVRAILRQRVDVNRIVHRDTQSYFGILLDNNNRKPLCRLHFNAKKKYIGIISADKEETRQPIDTVDDIFSFSEQLLATVDLYL